MYRGIGLVLDGSDLMATVFISYRRNDSAYAAAQVARHLGSRFGRDQVFFDQQTIPLGVDFRAHIAAQLADAQAVLAIIGATLYASFAGAAHSLMHSPAYRRTFNVTGGSLLVGAGIWALMARRPA